MKAMICRSSYDTSLSFVSIMVGVNMGKVTCLEENGYVWWSVGMWGLFRL